MLAREERFEVAIEDDGGGVLLVGLSRPTWLVRRGGPVAASRQRAIADAYTRSLRSAVAASSGSAPSVS